MRYSCVLFLGILCGFISSAIGSYDPYGSTHDDDYEPSYAAPPIVQPHHGHGHGHSAGSYYHYHVPLVGQQQQHYPQPYHNHHDHSQYLWPLLLLLALPLLFLPLLPLLLLPLGISLLALLAPGAMMMMMMMMMMGGEMMMRRDTVSGRAFNEMKTFGEIVLTDATSLFTKYARSLDLDQCPQRVACELGDIFAPEHNGTETGTAKSFANFILDQYIPKGRVKKMIKQYEKAFWNGYSLGKCSIFQCQPTFRIYQNSNSYPTQSQQVSKVAGAGSVSSSRFNTNQSFTQAQKENLTNYVYPSSKNTLTANDNTLTLTLQTSTEIPSKLKFKRSHISRHKVQKNDLYSNDKYFGVFGTPTVKS